MTPEELAAVKARHPREIVHGPNGELWDDDCGGGCTNYLGRSHPWPCDAALLLAEVDRLNAWVAAKNGLIDHIEAENARLRGACVPTTAA
jgi:hypothetical protein